MGPLGAELEAGYGRDYEGGRREWVIFCGNAHTVVFAGLAIGVEANGCSNVGARLCSSAGWVDGCAELNLGRSTGRGKSSRGFQAQQKAKKQKAGATGRRGDGGSDASIEGQRRERRQNQGERRLQQAATEKVREGCERRRSGRSRDALRVADLRCAANASGPATLDYRIAS